MGIRQRLAAMIPLQMIVMVIAIRNIAGSDHFLRIAGGLMLAGVLLTFAGYAVAWRHAVRDARD